MDKTLPKTLSAIGKRKFSYKDGHSWAIVLLINGACSSSKSFFGNFVTEGETAENSRECEPSVKMWTCKFLSALSLSLCSRH